MSTTETMTRRDVYDMSRPWPDLGTVVTYGDVAVSVGRDRQSDAVWIGQAVKFLGETTDYPWWRVVYSDGTLHTKDWREQALMLSREGHTIVYKPGNNPVSDSYGVTV